MFPVQSSIDIPLYLSNERAAIDRLRAILTSNLTRAHNTSEEEDCIQLAFLRDHLGAGDKPSRGAAGDDSADDADWRLLCALTYRITRKRVLKNAILLLEALIDWIVKIIASRSQVRTAALAHGNESSS